MLGATRSAPVIIDLSSDGVDDQPQPKAAQQAAYQFSDPFEEFEHIATARAGKRRRLSDDGPGAEHAAPSPESMSFGRAASRVRTAFSKRTIRIDDDDDDIVVSSSFEAAAETTTKDAAVSKHLSSTTAALLAEISGNAKATSKPGRAGRRAAKDPRSSRASVARDSLSPASQVRKLPESQRARQAASLARQAKREESSVAKAAEAARRKEIKEQKAREKQLAADFAKANQASQWDKKNSSSQMVVDISTGLANGATGARITAKLQELHIDHATKDREPANVVTWRRKVNTTFNEELNHWELAEEKVVDEKHVLCYFGGEDMCRILFEGSGAEELDQVVANVKRLYGDHQVLFLLEGVDAALRKFRTKTNKSYRNAVRQGTAMPAGADAAPQDHASMVESLEDTLMHLQIAHGCGVLQTAEGNETAEWIAAFTEQISTAPSRYVVLQSPRCHILTGSRIEKDNLEADFCMEIGQIRAGEDSKDTFTKMLQQVIRLTAPIAYGIVAHYPDVPSLVQAFQREGPLVLQDIKVGDSCEQAKRGVTDGFRNAQTKMEPQPKPELAHR